jgi:hypothetical protein
MKLSLYEQETILLYNQAEDTAEVYTHDRKLMEKLTRLSKKHPEQVCKKDKHNLRSPNAVCPSGSHTVPSAARLPVNGPRLPGTDRLLEKLTVSKYGQSF